MWRRKRRRLAATADTTGFDPVDRAAGEIDRWDDEGVASLNELLPWHAFTADTRGRRVGAVAWKGKRDRPQAIPDDRIELLDKLVGLSGEHVLELGCFEGIHTIALCDRSERVTALDSRVDNVVKTIVRTHLYGCRPDVVLADLETLPADSPLLVSDVLHHNGVLYHLSDPVRHLRAALRGTGKGLLLDTHVARSDQATSRYVVDGEEFQVHEFHEAGKEIPFAGMREIARWLTAEDLDLVVEQSGFGIVHQELREERNGDRVLIIARRVAG
jgi:hypothetical protein